MRRGRKDKPTVLHKLHGTYRAHRHADRQEPLAPGVLLEPPAWLNAVQRQRFSEILADAPRNLLRKWDAPTLAGYVVAESVVIEANKAREQGQLLGRTERGAVTITALLKVQARYLPLMKQFGELLGFSPTSRSSLKIEDTPDETSDPDWARWAYIEHVNSGPHNGQDKAWQEKADRLRKLIYSKP